MLRRPAPHGTNGVGVEEVPTYERAETQSKTTHHRFADYYNVNTTQPIPTLTIYYHISTPKFPSHTVGFSLAGSFVRFKFSLERGES